MKIETTPEGFYKVRGFGYTADIASEGRTFNQAFNGFVDLLRQQYMDMYDEHVTNLIKWKKNLDPQEVP